MTTSQGLWSWPTSPLSTMPMRNMWNVLMALSSWEMRVLSGGGDGLSKSDSKAERKEASCSSSWVRDAIRFQGSSLLLSPEGGNQHIQYFLALRAFQLASPAITESYFAHTNPDTFQQLEQLAYEIHWCNGGTKLIGVTKRCPIWMKAHFMGWNSHTTLFEWPRTWG